VYITAFGIESYKKAFPRYQRDNPAVVYIDPGEMTSFILCVHGLRDDTYVC
jgi:hypothetical protein